jgi:glycosyltransferase involved in cell wall biosynthesis
VESPLVTIVTPSFNQGRFIRATIESVLAQDYPYIEYLIVDGGSTDETADVAAAYHDKLTFTSEPDRGQSDAINKGFRRARGEIVAWLNSDDVLLPGAVTAAVEALTAEPALGAVYGNGYQIDEDGAMRSRFESQPFDLWRLVHVSDYILQQTAFFRASALAAVGLCDESLHYAMDWELFMRLGKRFELRHLRRDMGCIREYATTKTASGGARRLRELTAVMRRHGDLRYPPGMLVYGMDTYHRRIAAAIARLCRGPAARYRAPLLQTAARAAGYLTYRALRYTQGIHEDAWVTPKARLWFPDTGPGRLVLDIECPEWPGLAGQRLKIRTGARARTIDLAPGFERYVVDVPASSSGQPVKVELLASRSVAEKAALRYRRSLAYRIYGARFEPGGERRPAYAQPLELFRPVRVS